MSEEPAVFDGPYDSAWDAIEMDPVRRERLRMLSELSVAIELHVRAKGWTQKQAAEKMGVTQPRVSDLFRGKLGLFSIDSLVAMAAMAGMRISLNITAS